ncbi:MAG: SGNH/GDSL hydrolase family protein [Candidatus Marinimicrobia bacterium]|nr:SGNH/GDSL hydrolase family protein [Candidatus Neomarinimicrobiota bacterium]
MKHTNSWICSRLIGLLVFSVGLHGQTLKPAQANMDTSHQTIWVDGGQLTLEGQGWSQTKAHYGRLPANVEGRIPEAVWDLGQYSAGLSLSFTTNAEHIKVRWTLLDNNLAMPHMPATGVSGIDLYEKTEDGRWRFINNGRPTSLINMVEFQVTPNSELRLYLPLYNGVTSVEIGIPASQTLSAVKAKGKWPFSRKPRPIVFYGTSITQGGCVSRPGLAVSSIISREMDIPAINLGFSGSGKMEPEMAELLNELDPAVYVLDCLWNMDKEMVETRIKPFVKFLRQHHPRTPILLVEDSSFENVTPTPKGRILRRLYSELQAEEVSHLHFLTSEGMLGDDFEGTVDGVHHNDLGMMRQAEVFEKKLSAILNSRE